MGNARNIAFWVVLFLLILALFNLFSGGQGAISSRTVSYSDFISAVESGEVSRVTLDGERVEFRGEGGATYSTIRPDGADLTDLLISKDVEISARPQEQSGFTAVLMTFLPFLLLIGVWIYFMNRMQGGGRGGAMGFGKSRAKLLTEKHGRVTFDDVAGIDEAKDELEEIVEFLRNPQKFSRLGGKIPKGALLGRPSGHRQDAARACHRGRGGRAVLHHLRAPTSWRCSWAWALPACATCSSRPRRTRPASCSSTRSTPWGARAAWATAAATTSASRR